MKDIENDPEYRKMFKMHYQNVVDFDDPTLTQQERLERAHWRTRKFYFYKIAYDESKSSGRSFEEAFRENYYPKVPPARGQGTKEDGTSGQLLRDLKYFRAIQKIYQEFAETLPWMSEDERMERAHKRVRSNHFTKIEIDKSHYGEKTLDQALADADEFLTKKEIN